LVKLDCPQQAGYAMKNFTTSKSPSAKRRSRSTISGLVLAISASAAITTYAADVAPTQLIKTLFCTSPITKKTAPLLKRELASLKAKTSKTVENTYDLGSTLEIAPGVLVTTITLNEGDGESPPSYISTVQRGASAKDVAQALGLPATSVGYERDTKHGVLSLTEHNHELTVICVITK
jgi:hypothetical protein